MIKVLHTDYHTKKMETFSDTELFCHFYQKIYTVHISHLIFFRGKKSILHPEIPLVILNMPLSNNIHHSE